MIQTQTIKRELPTSSGDESYNLLHDRAIKFTRLPVPFDAIDLDASARNQARLLPVHEETIELYEAAMRDGAVFPPIVVDGTKTPMVIADGNHRLRAAIATGFEQADMFVITEATKTQIELFTYEANAKHGLPTTVEERVTQGVYLVSLGNAPLDVSKALSIPERKLWNAVSAARSRLRLDRLGAPSDWSSATLQRFGSVHSDVVVAPLVRLAKAARLGSSDTEALIVKINSLSTEADQLAYLGEMEVKYAPIIASTAGGAVDLPREINRLKIGLRMINSIDIDRLALALAQVDPALRGTLGRETIEAISHLVGVAAKFRK